MSTYGAFDQQELMEKCPVRENVSIFFLFSLLLKKELFVLNEPTSDTSWVKKKRENNLKDHEQDLDFIQVL